METNITEPHIQEKKHPELAGVGYRFLAHLLDGVIISVPYASLCLFCSHSFLSQAQRQHLC